MALRTPFDFPLDPVTNPLGEKMVSVADPIGSAPGARTYYLARRFDFLEGDYPFTVTADDAATVWLGKTQLDAQLIASATLPVPAQTTVYIAAGSYRLDVFLQNLPVEPTPCIFTMIIMRGNTVIYTSAKEGWLLDDAPISDADLPPAEDYRFSLPMFTVLPNWDNGILERLSWLTDVLSSETDAEQRRSIRRYPRRTFEAGFLRQAAQRARLDSFVAGVGKNEFMVPIWHEQVKLLDGLDMEGIGVNFPDGELPMREFRVGDLVFVNNGDPNDYDILQVGDLEANRFNWAFPPPRAWPVGTRIYPMRTARLLTPPSMSNITDRVSSMQMQFDFVDAYEVEPSFGANLGGEPLFRFTVDRASPFDASYDRLNYVLDNQVGMPVVTVVRQTTNITLQTMIRLFGRGNGYAMRQFLQACRGRSKKFMCSSFQQDVMLDGDVENGTVELNIQPQGFTSSMANPQPTRTMLAFQFNSGAQTLYRTVVGARERYKMTDAGLPAFPYQVIGETLVLNLALPAIAQGDLHRISFVSETRLDQDAVELQHWTNQQRVTDVALVLRQAYNQRNGNPT